VHPSIFIFSSYWVQLKGRFKFVCKWVLSYVVFYLRVKGGGGKGGQSKVLFSPFFCNARRGWACRFKKKFTLFLFKCF
jgi:hypothetical protein